MKTLLLAFLIIFNWMLASAQFTEPQEVPNGSTLTNYANVIAVHASGKGSSWSFAVTLESPDLGCEQYADWWEVLDVNGNLIYRRILAHSHVQEQPFTRSSLLSIEMPEDQVVWIRAHMNNTGYGGQALKGSPNSGFRRAAFPANLEKGQDKLEPLPNGCRF